jgi:hypothetical protein
MRSLPEVNLTDSLLLRKANIFHRASPHGATPVISRAHNSSWKLRYFLGFGIGFYRKHDLNSHKR